MRRRVPILRRTTKFTYAEWLWTRADENLFDMGDEALFFFRLLVEHAEAS